MAKKFLYIILILFVSNFSKSIAQAKVFQSAVKMNEMKDILGMKDQEFKKFKHLLALYNDSINAVMNKPNMTREERIKAVSKIQTNRQNYLKTIMSDDKYKKYVEFEKTMKRGSPYKKG